jgi:diguanylate cyclase
VGGSIRLVVVALVAALAVPACGGKEEAPTQAASLVTLGCRDGQGFHFARPLTAAAMTELLGKTVADGGFYLPNAAAPVESLSG